MKYIIILILIAVALLCYKCDYGPKVRFTEPQPAHKGNLKSIPKSYHGNYFNTKDSSLLTIEPLVICKTLEARLLVAKENMKTELDTVYERDTLIKEGSWSMKVHIFNDSAQVDYTCIDTLYDFSRQSVVKSFKGYLFLNKMHLDSTWSVDVLYKRRNELNINTLVSYDQIDSLKDVSSMVTEVYGDSGKISHYKLTPQKRDLKKLIKKSYYNTEYIRIRKNKE
jgi:hypothetical protein